jgi:UDP-N-acetylmuramoyl-L-alanyl-D-glutamate--2,6-diaminopimelate ligase
MVKNNCQYGIVESTSEGLAQNRHLGINFYGALITNLSPAHIDSHGSFDKYKLAKAKLFLNKSTLIGVNLDDKFTREFLSFAAENKFGISLNQAQGGMPGVHVYHATKTSDNIGITFSIENTNFNIPLIGEFNIYNCLLAIACAKEFGVSLPESANALQNFSGVPGRMETIPNNLGIKIIVDFACEPVPMQEALNAVSKLPHERLIHIFGSTGGLRDKGKRFEFGKISAQYADKIIITNDDVYDSNPAEIASNIKAGIESTDQGIKKVKEIETILDRRSAIEHAIHTSKPGDLLFFTGKASEQFLILPGNKRIAWDEPNVIKNILNKIE